MSAVAYTGRFGEGGVVHLHDLPGRLRGGEHERRDVAKAEKHDGAVPTSEPVHGLVWNGAEQEVHVADHRQRPWARRQVRPASRGWPEREEYGDDKDAEESVAHELDGCGFHLKVLKIQDANCNATSIYIGRQQVNHILLGASTHRPPPPRERVRWYP